MKFGVVACRLDIANDRTLSSLEVPWSLHLSDL